MSAPWAASPGHHYWPSNPWDHFNMTQRADHGSFSYTVAGDRASYTLRLHRALKNDYVLTGTTVTSPWQQLLTSLEDEILRRSGKILAGYVGQWALQHDGTLPAVAELAPAPAVGASTPTGRRTRAAASPCSPVPARVPTPTHQAPPAPTRSPSISTPATSRPAASRRRALRRRAAPPQRGPDPPQEAHLVTRHRIVVALATAALALLLAAAAPRPAQAVSFVDKQVQAGALLIQNYINAYGMAARLRLPSQDPW